MPSGVTTCGRRSPGTTWVVMTVLARWCFSSDGIADGSAG